MKRPLRLLPAISALLFATSAAHARDLPGFDASFQKKGTALTARPAQASAQASARASKQLLSLVAATDPRTAAPSFVWGSRSLSPVPAGATPASAARAHVAAYASLYGLSAAAQDTAKVAAVHDTGHGGIIVVMRQELGGIPVYRHDTKLLLRRDLSLVAVAGSLHPMAVDSPKARGQFALPMEGAVARALSDLYSMSLPSAAVAPSASGPKGEYQRFDLAPGLGAGTLRFERPARAGKVYFPMPDRLVPAYYVEVFASEKKGESDSYAYVIAADSGQVLSRRNMTDHAAFKYRVFAEMDGNGRPFDGPVADFTPHPTGVPDGSGPAFVLPNLVTMDGFNKTKDPWLAEGATETKGNNIDAYTDHDDSNGPGGEDVRAQVTAPGELDRTYDTAKSPVSSVEQEMAAITQLFYTTNWLHDYWYDSGFDELSGNAQANNYGRGGAAGDPLLVEAQDAYDKGSKNNANMETPNDGESPRMQMYVWDGQDERSLTCSALSANPQTAAAEFGLQTFDVTAGVALADDGVSPNSNGCEPFVNDVKNKIALVDRGNCTFHEKAINAEKAGAIGMLLANNQGGPPPFMPASNFPDVGIAVMGISKADGALLKTALVAGPVTATLKRQAAAEVDGTIDNLIVSHEWGHYLHHRLVNCQLNQCGGESEGWGDFVALTTQLRPTDDLDGAFSDSTYAAQGLDNFAYYGVRRYPYSTDMKKNPLTFQHIQASSTLPAGPPMADVFPDNSEAHNTGEVWASMLFEGFTSILKQSKGANPKYSFEEARRKMADYVVGGLKMAPSEPTFTEQRDAIVAAAYASDPADALLIAQGFAKRGAGSCAESPNKDSFDNNGVVESFVVAPAVSITSVTLDDSVASCDKDARLDAGETGKLTIVVANKGYLPAPMTEVKVTTSTPGVVFPNGASQTLAELDGFTDKKIELQIKIDPAQKVPGFVDLTVTAVNPAACNPNVTNKQSLRVNYDNALAVSATDDFESDVEVWTPKGKDSTSVWAREADEKGNHVWHGVDFSSLSDTALVSKTMQVADTGNLVLSFKHRHMFETSPEDPQDPASPIVNWDGAVVEISKDGGSTWEDVSKYGDAAYTGQIGNLAENPLKDRQGYTDVNKSWPDMDPVTIDMGKAFAGQVVEVRFRIGSDQAASAFGWEIDDVSLEGITGTPFPAVVPDAQSCTPVVDHAPIANAGPDQVVESGATVTLDASQSSDPDGDELALSWAQVGGTNIVLTGDGAKATFTAPTVSVETTYLFAAKAVAKGLSSTDTVKITVKPGKNANPDDLMATGGGCGCSVPGESDVPAAPLGAIGSLALGLYAARRRRSTAKGARSGTKS